MEWISIARAYDWSLTMIDKDASGSNALNLNRLTSGFFNIYAEVAGALAFLYLVYSGILYLTAAGNPDNAKKGAQGVLNAIIGIVIIVAAWAILNAINGTLLGL